MNLPTDDKQRKALPIFDGVVMYFPKAMAAIAEVSRVGNEQHNPGQPLHWARGKSTDQFNTGLRHTMDHRMGTRYDTDGTRHLAKAAWRALAALELDIEEEAKEEKKPGTVIATCSFSNTDDGVHIPFEGSPWPGMVRPRPPTV